jgi:hypothetical protein
LHHRRLNSAVLSLLLVRLVRLLLLAMPHRCRMRAAAAAAAALPVPPLGGGIYWLLLLLLLLEVWLLPLRCCLRLPTGRSVVVADSLPPPKGASRGWAWHWPLCTASCALVLALLLLLLLLLLVVLPVLLLLVLSLRCDRPRGSLHTTCTHPTAAYSPLLRPVRSCRCRPRCACRRAATPEGLQVGCRGCCCSGCLPTHALVLVGRWLGACSANPTLCFSV